MTMMTDDDNREPGWVISISVEKHPEAGYYLRGMLDFCARTGRIRHRGGGGSADYGSIAGFLCQ
jgi:hypothetical protein